MFKTLIQNTQIYNSSNFGVLGRATNIKAENTVINKSGQSSFAATFGGHYDIVHSTIVNYWTNSFRQFPALLLNNFTIGEDQNTIPNNLSTANFTNCIIYGNDNPELILDNVSGAEFNFKFKNCLLLFSDNSNVFSSPYYNFDDLSLYDNMLLNIEPKFFDSSQNLLQIPLSSPAASAGTTSGNLNTDITGTQRSTPPALGAYNATELEN
tara:strand:- start:200 stop:829 length:630 start_codon:yes stop_codon:yes gene_type:complete